MAVGIAILNKGAKRDWLKLASASAETISQAILVPDGFSNAVSAFFRTIEGMRGEDLVETRAANLVMETLAYAVAELLIAVPLKRPPAKVELQILTKSILDRADLLAQQSKLELTSGHLAQPTTLSIFEDATRRIVGDLQDFGPQGHAASIEARFRDAISGGLNRVRTRRPEYFRPVVEALVGPDAIADARTRAWADYRSSLIRRFEDTPVFGEPEAQGVTIAQAYQPLRTWWGEAQDDDTVSNNPPTKPKKKVKQRISIRMLEGAIHDWLNTDDKGDRIRLVSGGPGSGKSTFAKRLAAVLSTDPRWRTIFVPLQRLKGAGPLAIRIDDYFKLHLDEPFDNDTAPLAHWGQDNHRDWVVIFDGLDELAKEGASSESAAQDFASALSDWRLNIGERLAVRFIVLGRAPSMQEARRRLSLHGKGTLNVADMLPMRSIAQQHASDRVELDDPDSLIDLDQRHDFWRRWSIAKGEPQEPPPAMTEPALADLTKEPLLAYLLIMSGYASTKWKEAAENRNRIYQSIFERIWERERTKDTRTHLNDIGKEGFDALMESLGLAAWGGGGRTGDEQTFAKMRDVYMRRDLLMKAQECGAANLGNVALLFYTRKDEEGGRGYEFLHKSFGEYLTACGLFRAFLRWGNQFRSPHGDFTATDFLQRWLKLTGSAPLTAEIVSFMENEVRLEASRHNENSPWQISRDWTTAASLLAQATLKDGIPAHTEARTWRDAERRQRNAEEALFCLLSACARAAYPARSYSHEEILGGWNAGPVRIPGLQETSQPLLDLLARILPGDTYGNASGWVPNIVFENAFEAAGMVYSRQVFRRALSRLSLQDIRLRDITLAGFDLTGVNLRNASLQGTRFYRSNLGLANLDGISARSAELRQNNFNGSSLKGAIFQSTDLSHSTFQGADLSGSTFFNSKLTNVNFTGCRMHGVDLRRARIQNSDFSKADLRGADLRAMSLEGLILDGANLSRARLRHANLKNAKLKSTNFEGADLRGVDFEGAKLRGAKFDGANTEGANFANTILSEEYLRTRKSKK